MIILFREKNLSHHRHFKIIDSVSISRLSKAVQSLLSLMITAESMSSKRPVLRINAAEFSSLSYFRPIFERDNFVSAFISIICF